MKLVVLAVVSGLAIVLVGCVDKTAHQALVESATDTLGCSDFDIDVLSESSGRDQPSIVDYRVTGCGQTARLQCEDDHQSPDVDYSCTLQAHTTVTSQVAIDGAAFVPDGADLCRAGSTDGQAFYGVDLEMPSGAALRLERNLDLTYAVIAFDADGDNSPPMQGCATVDLTADPLAGLDGIATILCASGPWTVTGAIAFAGCE